MRVQAGFRLFRTTAFKLSLVHFVVFALLSVFLIGYIAHTTTQILASQMQETIGAEIKGLAEQYRTGGIRKLVEAVDLRSRRPGASLYLLNNARGQTLAGNVAGLPPQGGAREGRDSFRVTYRRLDDSATPRSHVALVRVFTLPGGFTLLVGRDIGEREAFARVVRRALVIAAASLVGLSLLSWYFTSRYVLRRIESMSRTGRRIMEGDLSGRLEITGSGDEFDRLASDLNAMLARIERLMLGLKDVTNNIAHDLKTPLTRLRSRVEAALATEGSDSEYRAALEAAIGDADQLIRIFNALLMIARTEAGTPDGSFATLDAGVIVGEVMELYEPLAEEMGVSVTLQTSGDLTFSGNRELIGQAVANLVDNALKHAGEGHAKPEVELIVEGGREAIHFDVLDSGPGIPVGERERVRERFVRLDNSRTVPGSGLGLSLVTAVAHLHQGELVLGDSPRGGLHARLVIPRRQSDASL